MFHELDIVLENLPAFLLPLPEYIEVEVDSGRRDKAEGLLEALLHLCCACTAAVWKFYGLVVHSPSLLTVTS